MANAQFSNERKIATKIFIIGKLYKACISELF